MPRLTRYSETLLPTVHGHFKAIVYRRGERETIAITLGDLGGADPVFVRAHAECFTGEALGSLACDCGERLNQALAHIQRIGRGVVVYLRDERRAHHLESRAPLPRDHRLVAEILADLGVARVQEHGEERLRA
jgi:GTP cyclohydrolase II